MARSAEPPAPKDAAPRAASGALSPLFDMELSQHFTRRLSSRELEVPWLHSIFPASNSIHLVQTYCQPANGFESQLLADVHRLKHTCIGSNGFSVRLLAEALCALSYHAELQTQDPAESVSRPVGRRCLENLHHNFIRVINDSAAVPQRDVVVEPRFKEQFQIAHSTPAYDALLQAVPLDFVGTSTRLRALVELLCAEVAAAFQEQDRPLPPWRKLSSVLSKWRLDTPQRSSRQLPPLAYGEQARFAAQQAQQADLPASPTSTHRASTEDPAHHNPASAGGAPPLTHGSGSKRRLLDTLEGVGGAAGAPSTPSRGKRVVSLLAKGLASVSKNSSSASIPAAAPAEAPAKPKIRRSGSWNLGLPRINTVRRLGPSKVPAPA
ncbi:hypothetical protein WJX72_010189 [[Myrmecia] bisecta]|uniref:Uncharacterized protein n=1 Tax=[Myrmecia] bisecta TaxID=41462 RepID=A0AAW1R9B5_9CHLO